MLTDEELIQSPISSDLPDRIVLKIGHAITRFARLENIIVELSWRLSSADLTKKKTLAKNGATDGFKYIRKQFKSNPEVHDLGIWDMLKELVDERNIIAHGAWAITSEGLTFVVWHSRFLESEEYVGAEWFDEARIDRFIGATQHSIDMFVKLDAAL